MKNMVIDLTSGVERIEDDLNVEPLAELEDMVTDSDSWLSFEDNEAECIENELLTIFEQEMDIHMFKATVETGIETLSSESGDLSIAMDDESSIFISHLEKRDSMSSSDEIRYQPASGRIHSQKSQFKGFYLGIKPNAVASMLKTLKANRRVSNSGFHRSILAPLESRVDLVLFRSGLVASLAQARHVIHHGHVTKIDGKTDVRLAMKAPGHQLKPLDVLIMGDGWKSGVRQLIANRLNDDRMTSFSIPSYLEVDFAKGKVCFERYPEDGEVLRPVGMTVTLDALKDRFKK